MGHKRFLGNDYRFCKERASFEGSQEMRPAPTIPSGNDIIMQTKGVNYCFRKTRKKVKTNKKGKKNKKSEKKKKRRGWGWGWGGKIYLEEEKYIFHLVLLGRSHVASQS